MEGAYVGTNKNRRGNKVADDAPGYNNGKLMPIKDIARELSRLEEKMYAHARNLEFEEAAQTRDQLEKLRHQSLNSPS